MGEYFSAELYVWKSCHHEGARRKIANRASLIDGQDRFRAKTGLPIATYFSGPKIKWILENDEGLREKAEAGDIIFGNIDSWVIWQLTGGTDGVSFQNNSSGTRTFGTLGVSGGSGDAFLHGAGGGNVTVNGAATLSDPVGTPDAMAMLDSARSTASRTFRACS